MKTTLAPFAMLLAVAVAGCQTAPPEPPPQPAPQPVMPAPEPEPAPPPPPEPVGPPPGSPAARQQAQQLLRTAAESLNDGNEDKARGEINEALRLDPDSKLGACLRKGITADPEQTLGKQSMPYTVRPGETLGRIAQRALGDQCEFYLLARYNKIRVPKQLAGGQVIRTPGRVALAGPDAAPPAKPQSEVPAAKPEAPAPAPAVEAPAPPPKPASPTPQEIRAQIDRHQRNAQAAFRRQDLTTAIAEWDKVLALDPNNDLARARRQEAIDLDRRLKQLK